MKKDAFKNIAGYFFQGLFYTAPLAITVYVLYLIFEIINDLTISLTEAIFGMRIPGLGFVMVLILITLIGYFGKNLLSERLAKGVNHFLSSIPIVKSIYSPVKDIISAFVGKEKKFTNPALVKMSEKEEVYRVGFVTQKDLSKLELPEEFVAVYFPYSYGFMGELLLVPSKNVKMLNIPSAEALKFAISGGLTEISGKESKNGKEEDNVEEQIFN